MPTLADIQRLFSAGLDSKDSAARLSQVIASSDKLRAVERINIYRQNIVFGHIAALEESFPVCKELVGEKYFRQLARAYFKANPSGSEDLNCYGQTFPEYLEEIVASREEARELVYLPDVARLEWCWYESYYAEDDCRFDFEGFNAAVARVEGEITFELSKSLRLLRSDYPVSKVWKANREGSEEEIELNCELDSGGECLVVFREDYIPRIEVVDEGVWQALKGIQEGNCLEVIADRDSIDLPELIPGLIKKLWICGFQS